MPKSISRQQKEEAKSQTPSEANVPPEDDELYESKLVVRDPWKISECPIYHSTGKYIKINCPQYGVFAILFDRCSDGKGMYTLYHKPTDAWVVHVNDLSSAMEIGELLWHTSPSSFRIDDKEDLLAAIPKWIPGWIKRCKEAKTYVEVQS